MAVQAHPAHQASSVSNWLRSSSRHRPLCERTVLELSRRIQRWQQHPGGPSHAPKPVRQSALRAREQLVRHNLSLVAHTWSRHRSSLPAHNDTTADALQEGALNLMRAAEKFDPAKGYCFSTYASFWIRRGFHDFEQRCKRAIRIPAEKAAIVLKALRLSQQHLAAHGTTPALSWLADQLRFHGKPLTTEQLTTFIRQWDATQTVSIDNSREDGEVDADWSRSHHLDAVQHHPAAADTEAEAEAETDNNARMQSVLSVLSEREQRLIRNRYLRRPALSPAQLRRSLGDISECDLEQLEAQALEKMRQAAQKLGEDNQKRAVNKT
jgi:RNA polymerase sigma factor (sigma-70 family)